MRTLTPSIQNALASLVRRPALKVELFDPIAHFALYQTGGLLEGRSAACIANDGSIIRAFVTDSIGAFSAQLDVQRITDPGNSTQWNSWTVLGSTDKLRDAGCALSNNSGTLRLFAQSGVSPFNLLVWTSVDNGASWTGPVNIAAINAAVRGIGSAGQNDVFFAKDDAGGVTLSVSLFSGSWSAPTTWTLGSLAACQGIDAAWDATNSRFVLAVSDGRAITGYRYTPSGGTWGVIGPIAPLDSATSVGLARLYPRLHVFDGLFNLAYLEVDTGAFTGLVSSLARLRQSGDFEHWSDGLVLEQTFTFGPTWLKAPTPPAGSAGPAYYVMNNRYAWRAPTYSQANPSQYLDVSAQVLEVQRHEARNRTSRLLLRLSNAGGQYNSLPMLGLNTSIAVSEGYHDPSTGIASTIATGIYYVDRYTYLRAPNQHELLIEASDATKRFGTIQGELGPTEIHWKQPHTVKHVRHYKTKPPRVTYTTHYQSMSVHFQRSFSGKSLSYLLTEIAAIARIFTVSIPGTSQFSQIVPTFVIPAGATLKSALDELCAIYSVYYFLDQTETLQFRELSGADAPVTTFQPELETLTFGSLEDRANHIVVTGRTSAGALVYGESYDFSAIYQSGLERPLYHTDTRLTSASQAALKAGFLLADEQRAGTHHTISVPAHPGLQLLDVITVTDQPAPRGTGQSKAARIVALEVSYLPEEADASITLTLEQP